MKLAFLFLTLLIALPGFGQEEDETLAELERQRKEQAAVALEIDQTTQTLKSVPANLGDELSKAGHSTLNAASLLDDRVVLILQKTIQESQIHQTSPDVLKAMIMSKAGNGPMSKVFRENPKLLNLAASILGDKEALPALLGLFLRKDDLKKFAYVSLGLLIMGFIIRKLFFSKEWSFFKRLGLSLTLSLLISSLSVGFFYHFFKDELSPLISVISREL